MWRGGGGEGGERDGGEGRGRDGGEGWREGMEGRGEGEKGRGGGEGGCQCILEHGLHWEVVCDKLSPDWILFSGVSAQVEEQWL